MPLKKRPLDRDSGVLRDARLIVIASEDTYAVADYFKRFRTRRLQFIIIPTEGGQSRPKTSPGAWTNSSESSKQNPTTSSGSASTRTIGQIPDTSTRWFRCFNIAGRRVFGPPSAIPVSNCGCCCTSRTRNSRRTASAVRSGVVCRQSREATTRRPATVCRSMPPWCGMRCREPKRLRTAA